MGFPTGHVIAYPLRILDVPTDLAISTTAHICTTGIPKRSISFAIVAPQRVLVPHVEVKIAADICFFFKLLAIRSPFAREAATEAQFPHAT